MLGRTQKLLLGVAILLLVNVLWVSSNELTKVITYIHIPYKYMLL